MHRNLFQRRETAELMVSTIFRYRDAGEFQLHEYVVMPDHIHLLLSSDTASSLHRAVQLIKGGFSHALRGSGTELNAVWQPRYHEGRVRDIDEFTEISTYIRENPVRRGLSQSSAEYPYSCAANNSRLDRIPNALTHDYQISEPFDAALKRRSTNPKANHVLP